MHTVVLCNRLDVLPSQGRGHADARVEAGGEVAQAHLRVGKPDEEILRLSEEIVAGLIVIGTQGLGGRFSRMRRFLMGSVSEKVTRYARCSVTVIRKDLYDRPSA